MKEIKNANANMDNGMVNVDETTSNVSETTTEIEQNINLQQDIDNDETTIKQGENEGENSLMSADDSNFNEPTTISVSNATDQPEKEQPLQSNAEFIESIKDMSHDEVLSTKTLERIINMSPDLKYRGLQALKDRAKKLKIDKPIINGLLREVENSMKKQDVVTGSNKVQIEGIPELETGNYYVNENHIKLDGAIITTTPILPIRITKNVNSNDYKVTVVKIDQGELLEMTIPMKILLSANLLSNLANKGVDVSSENSHALAICIRTLLRLNKTKLKVVSTANAFGWDDRFNEFHGIIGNTLVDDNGCDESLAKHVTTNGNEIQYLSHYKEILANNLPLRLVVVTSLASVLLKPLNILPFFFHLYGTSGVGKTLALMHAAAVWGNPAPGALLKSLNGTINSFLRLASTAKNLPLTLDELEVIRNYAGYKKLVMIMSTGVERSRLNSDATQAVQGTWQNIFILNGESSMLRDTDEAGVANRVLEFEVSQEKPAIQELSDGAKIAQFLKTNHGFLGKLFLATIVSAIQSGELFDVYNRILAEIMAKYETTTKIGVNIAAIMTADFYLYRNIFDQEPLSVDDVEDLVTPLDAISPSVPAKKFILNFINSNKSNFDIKDDVEPVNTRKPIGKCIGKIHIKADKTVVVSIMKNKLSDALASKSYSFDSVKNEWANQGFLVKNGKHFDKYTYVNGLRCYVVNLQFSMTEEEEK